MIGIDEVGRGAWAGPLTVAGCYFTENPGFIQGLNDSKQLSREQRLHLEPHIMSSTIFEVVHVSPADIDRYGLTECMRRASVRIIKKMPDQQLIVIDGTNNFLKNTNFANRTTSEVKADTRFPSVMAASVLAKVSRDRIMQQYAIEHPEYGFETNVGYGTAQHLAAIKRIGLLDIHRISYRPMKEMVVI